MVLLSGPLCSDEMRQRAARVGTGLGRAGTKTRSSPSEPSLSETITSDLSLERHISGNDDMR